MFSRFRRSDGHDGASGRVTLGRPSLTTRPCESETKAIWLNGQIEFLLGFV